MHAAVTLSVRVVSGAVVSCRRIKYCMEHINTTRSRPLLIRATSCELRTFCVCLCRNVVSTDDFSDADCGRRCSVSCSV